MTQKSERAKKRSDNRAGNSLVAVLVTDVGGPVALYRILSDLPADLSFPIIILPPSEPVFLESSISALQRLTTLRLHTLSEPARLAPADVYFASPNQACALQQDEEGLCLSSATPARGGWLTGSSLEQFASVLGRRLLVVFLSGTLHKSRAHKLFAVLTDREVALVVLNHEESPAGLLGQAVLQSCPQATEMTTDQIIELLASAGWSKRRSHTGSVSAR